MTGGGWIASNVAGQKAHFAFQAKCEDDQLANGQWFTRFSEGQLQFSDPAAGVRLHGDIDPSVTLTGFGPCEDPQASLIGPRELDGTYRPQPKGAEGRFHIELTDGGEPGAGDDTFSIELTGGEYNGYSNSGPLGGGNIQVTEE